MKPYFLLLLLMLSFPRCFGQQFLDKFFTPVRTKAEATYYRTIEKQDGMFLVKDFYCSNDQLYREAPCKFIKPELMKHGKVICYHENGKLASESYYDLGDLDGPAKAYYENGQPEEETFHTLETVKYLQVWSEAGEALLKNGTGEFIKYDKEEQATVHKEYKDSILYRSFSARAVQQDTIYITPTKQAEFNGGFEAMAKFVGQTLRYPANSRRAGIQGTVFVSFIVDKNGELSELEVIKGVSDDLDEEALRCVKESSGQWIAGMHDDSKVKSRFVLPIKFKIAG